MSTSNSYSRPVEAQNAHEPVSSSVPDTTAEEQLLRSVQFETDPSIDLEMTAQKIREEAQRSAHR